MLNCSELLCVLQHHHFYAHLHHLKHHLQDDIQENSANRFDKSIEDNDNIYSLTNGTDSELSSLSHVDAPNDIIYIIGGVLIAMAMVAIIIVSVAAAINKLRKREETSPEHLNTVEAQQKYFGQHNTVSSIDYDQQRFTTFTVENCNKMNPKFVNEGQGENGSAQTDWVFPPKAPTPNICYYNNNFDGANCNTEAKGFRKQFSGRFKRLMIYKKTENSTAIPPELKPQLKSIYVY